MKFKQIAIAAATAAALIGASSAHAYVWNTTAGSFSSVVGASNIDFGASTPNNGGPVVAQAVTGDVVASGSVSGINYQFQDGALYNPTNSGILNITERPVGSTGNFWSVGEYPKDQKGSGVVTFSKALSYVGFLYGSVDSYNSVSFFSGEDKFLTLTGTQIMNPANGTVSTYFNFFAGAGQAVTKMAFESGKNAFETDNFAITAVPEVETYAMMLAGLGLMGTIARRRNKSKTA